jgi:hypothetical protein
MHYFHFTYYYFFFNSNSGRVVSNWVHSVLRPLIDLLCQPRVIMIMERLVEYLAGETEVLGENLPQCCFVHHKPHMLCSDANPGRHDGKFNIFTVNISVFILLQYISGRLHFSVASGFLNRNVLYLYSFPFCGIGSYISDDTSLYSGREQNTNFS